MATPKQQRSFTWMTRRDGNKGFVLEVCTDHLGQVIYEKEIEMPANHVPNYVIGRRRVVAMEAERNGASYIEDESGSVN